MRSHGKGRGSRNPRGVWSAVTLATIPSGVTIDLGAGFVTTSGVSVGDGTNFMVTYTSVGYKVSGGNTTWAGTSLSLTHGFTTLTGFSGMYQSRAATYPVVVEMTDNGISGAVSAAAYIAAYVTKPLMYSGGTLFWTAFGT